MKKLICLLLGVLVLSSCSSIKNLGNSLTDKGTRYATSLNVGKNYQEVASQRDWTLERRFVIGRPVGQERLKNNNTIYFHEIKQESPSTPNFFTTLTFGDKHVRYDYYAYLVSPSGVILDYAHKRSNAKISHFGYDTGVISVDLEGDEVNNEDIEQVKEFVTSSGKSLQSWK